MTIEDFTKLFREESERQLEQITKNNDPENKIQGFSIVTVIKRENGVGGVRHIEGDLSVGDVYEMHSVRTAMGRNQLNEVAEKSGVEI